MAQHSAAAHCNCKPSRWSKYFLPPHCRHTLAESLASEATRHACFTGSQAQPQRSTDRLSQKSEITRRNKAREGATHGNGNPIEALSHRRARRRTTVGLERPAGCREPAGAAASVRPQAPAGCLLGLPCLPPDLHCPCPLLCAYSALLGLPVHFSVPPEPFPVVFSSPVHACMQAANGGSPQLVGNRELLACSSRFHSQLQKLPVPWHWHGFFPNLKLSY